MSKKFAEDKEKLKEKLSYIGLNLDKLPKYLSEFTPFLYRPSKSEESNNYKIYKHIDVNDIQILLTPTDRLTNLSEKYKLAKPIFTYLDSNNKENIERFTIFLKMLNDTSMQEIKEIEKQQKKFKEQTPYAVKYSNNYIWQIYYSDISDQYFMLVPTNDMNNVALFYLLKKQIEAKKNRRKETIYVPISSLEYSGNYLTRAQITDLENYLWYFTKDWANIFEIYDYKNRMSIKIVGKAKVYEKIETTYTITVESKEDALEIYKLIKALFILSTAHPNYYNFKTEVNESGELEFIDTVTNEKITYDNLTTFIQKEIDNKNISLSLQDKFIIELQDNLDRLKTNIEDKTEKFLIKQRQIATFLECKRSFFRKVRYYFSNRKKVLKPIKNIENQEKKPKTKNIPILEQTKNQYTIEDLIEICNKLEAREKVTKKLNIDIKALELKSVNLDKKIKNANIYLNEIELHKKSIFEFWKFSNKDELPSLNEGEEEVGNQNEKIKKSFDYEEDIDDLGKKIDEIQRIKLSKNEADSIFAIKQVLNSFRILNKAKSKDLSIKQLETLQNELKMLQKEYESDIETIKIKDLDIFGNMFDYQTKTKTIKNIKHRENQRDKYRILNINSQTELDIYIDNIRNYLNLIKEALCKISTIYNMPVYLSTKEELDKTNLQIFHLDENSAIKDNLEEDTIYLYKLNLKEKMPILYYSNIIFFDNINKTLPLGMDLSDEVLINLEKYSLEEIATKEFKYNYIKDEFNNKIVNVKLIELDVKFEKD